MEHVTRLNLFGFFLLVLGIGLLTFDGIAAIALSLVWWGPLGIVAFAIALIIGGAALAGHQRG